MKHVFIVNPLAGAGKSLKIAKNIENVCKNEKLNYTIHYTNAPMDATSITKKYQNSESIIYSVGGDGTMNEVLNGIIGSKNLLGIIPAGSGNDFTRDLKSIEDLTPTIDIGKINNRYFINIVCFGIDAEVAANVTLMKEKKIPSSQIYNLSIVYTLIKYKFKEIEYALDNASKKDKFTLFAICNGKYYGGGFKIAPNADLSDGLFDIYSVNKVSKFKIPYLFLKLIRGVHETIPILHKNQSDSIVINSHEQITCNVDGESLSGTHFDVSIIKNAITLYNNKELINKFLEV